MNEKYRIYSNSVVIAPKILHDHYLSIKREEPLLRMRLFSLEEVESLFNYSYDDRAKIFLLKKGYGYEESLDILSCASYMREDREYVLPRLKKLVPLFKELRQENLLYRFEGSERLFANQSILIDSYHDGARISRAFEGLSNLAMGYIVHYDDKPFPDVCVFKDIYEELHYVYNRIADDLASGTSIDDIYVLGLNGDYDALIHEFNKHFGFSIEESFDLRLFDRPIYHLFQKSYLEGKEDEFFLDATNAKDPDYASLRKMFLRYGTLFDDRKKNISLLDDISKTIRAASPRRSNIARRLNSAVAPSGSHVYILNFSMGVFPSLAAEDPYIHEDGCHELGKPTKSEIDEERKAEINHLLSSGLVKSVSFKSKGNGNIYFPSGLVNVLKMNTVENPSLPYEYSDGEGKFLEADLLDWKTNFLYVDPRLPSLEKNRPIAGYRSFDYRYKQFASFEKKSKFSFSFTGLDQYYSCPFSYYVQRVAGIKDFETTFNLRIGNIFHKVMELHYESKGSDFLSSWEEALKEENENGEFTNEEKLLLESLKCECSRVVSFYDERDSMIVNPSVSVEKTFSLPIEGVDNLTIDGKYDKIVSFGPHQENFIILDYKTGAARFSESLVQYGLSLQLPIYALYAKKDQELSGKTMVGMFIAPILDGSLYQSKQDANKNFDDMKKASYKLDGLFLNDVDKLRQLDPYCDKSSLIVSLSINKDGFFKANCAKVKTSEDFASLSAAAETKVVEAAKKILNGDFPIEPLKTDKKGLPCDHCAYRDICYRDDEAIKYISKKKDDDEEDDDDDSEEADDGR